jgi:hypothetical protein
MQMQQQQPPAAAARAAGAGAGAGAGAEADEVSDCAHLTALTIARLVGAARRAGVRTQTHLHSQQSVADGGCGEYDAAKFRADAVATVCAPAATSAGAGAAGAAANAGDAADLDPVRYVLRPWLRPLLAATAPQSAAPRAATAQSQSLAARRGGADEALCLQVRLRFCVESRALKRASERERRGGRKVVKAPHRRFR